MIDVLTAHRVACGWCQQRGLLMYDDHRRHMARILAARLADVEARLAAARAEGTLAERERIDDALGLAGFDTDAPGPIRAALHPDPSEARDG